MPFDNIQINMNETKYPLTVSVPIETRLEMSERGKEVVRLWQACKSATDPAERRRLAIEFYEKLAWASTPQVQKEETDKDVINANRVTKQNSGHYYNDAEADCLVDDILNRGEIGGNGKEIGTGTRGERIFFHKTDSKGKNPSTDGKVRWMIYPDPTFLYENSSSAKNQKKVWWSAFVATFGSNEVDLIYPV